MPNLTVYQSPFSIDDVSVPVLGQAHFWFFLKLKDQVEINLEKSLEEACSDFKWTSFDELITITGNHKKHIYETLHTYFKEHILE